MNKLALESSPYLLQHANNPVHWLPWSDEVFKLAKKENKPVLVSVGYSSCHWCHVMAHESFEDEEVAALMNELFINIKVDREEMPDVDYFLMDAVQAMSGTGGWPLNIFLTPDKKPFYGGTYFPPKRMSQRASWREVLINVYQYFAQNRNEVEIQATRLHQHLINISTMNSSDEIQEENLDSLDIHVCVEKIMSQADIIHGGFGTAPKFPSTHTLKFLLEYALQFNNSNVLNHVTHSLLCMINGGIYDHIGGGFSRYSTDKEWFAPHFEKMLYDNALLLDILSKTYAITKNEKVLEVIEETVAWLQREMSWSNANGIGFYTAQDADSEGEEGKYYTWTAEEVKTILGEDFQLFAKVYNINKDGNWEGTNILYVKWDDWQQLSKSDKKLILDCKQILLKARAEKVPPLTDNKILLGWNSLMCKALVSCYLYIGNQNYLDLAIKNANFLLQEFINMKEGGLFHTYKEGKVKIEAFADDLVYLADALLELALATDNKQYYLQANEILTMLELNYKKENDVLLSYSNINKSQLEINKQEIIDGATPSSNSVYCKLMLVFYTDEQHRQQAIRMLQQMKTQCLKYPSSFSVWCECWAILLTKPITVKIKGEKAQTFYQQFRQNILSPFISFELVKFSGEVSIEVCKDNMCYLPVSSIEKAKHLIL